jgi:hypothetical protein
MVSPEPSTNAATDDVIVNVDIEQGPDKNNEKGRPRVSRNTKLLEKLSEDFGRLITGKEKGDVRELLKLLNLDSVETLDEFLGSRRWKRHYAEYERHVLAPGREQAKAAGKAHARGPDLAKVQEALTAGELYGQGLYSDIDPDKSKWGTLEYSASFLWNTRKDARLRGGIAFGKNFSDAMIDYCLWQILGREIFQSSPSRSRKPKPNTVASSAAPGPAEAGFNNCLSETSAQTSTTLQLAQEIRGSSSRPEGQPNQTANPEMQAGPTSRAEDRDDDGDHGNSEIDNHGPEEHLHRDSDGAGSDDPDNSDRDQDGRCGGRPLSRAPTPEGRLLHDLPLDLYQMMVNEREHNNINIQDRWGKYKIVHLVLENYGNPEIINSLAEQVDNIHGQDAFLWMEEMGLDRLENPCNTSVLKDEHINRYRAMERMLTNPLYERMDLAGACARLHIPNQIRPRMPGLVLGVHFYPWQVTGIDGMKAFSARGLRGGLLADGIGTGKSLVIHGLMIEVSM